jgi:Ca2+-binding EF-hand superfamily protein
MFSFRRKKIIEENDESIEEIENLVQTLNKDGNGRIRIVDLENALQRMDEDNRSKAERKKQVKKFRE